jgi:hypothetical protein
MGYRYNERNTGSYTMEGNLKSRSKSKKITDDEKVVAKAVLLRVAQCMEYDKEMNEGKGHLNPNAIFTDGNRFILSLTGEQLDKLWNVIDKL